MRPLRSHYSLGIISHLSNGRRDTKERSGSLTIYGSHEGVDDAVICDGGCPFETLLFL